MQTSNQPAPSSRPLRLTLAAPTVHRGVLEVRGEAVARYVHFVKSAAEQTVRVWTLVAARDRDPVRADIAAMCRVLRVRANLAPADQLAFDQLTAEYPATMLGLLFDRDDLEALAAVQHYLAAMANTLPG